MVFVGDLYQLPPVVNSQERAIFSQHYTSPYFFSAHGLADCKIEVIELEKVYRQQDQGFIDLLNKIRNNSVEAEDIDQLNSRYQADFIASEDEFYISLTTTNKKADQINDRHLQALTGELHCFHADIKGDVGREYFPTATELQLKSGSQIMLLNNDQKKRWVNGSIGVIEGIHTAANGEPYLTVVLQDSNKRVFVSRFVWEVYKFSLVNQQIVSEPVGTFSQFPLRLAWAVTIHKSQGKTFDRVIIDMGRGAFAAGQTYVGLSRCTTFQGIVLSTPIKKQHIRTDPRIFKFLTGYQYRKAAQQLSVADRVELIQQAINEQAELQILYLKANDIKSERVVKPLEVGIMTYQGKEFPGMQAICRKRRDQRIFHVGRILQISKLAG
jgi:ATP-dependent exoDNAse (exonuclease V) alpha subunit